jgi:hypothetical protein
MIGEVVLVDQLSDALLADDPVARIVELGAVSGGGESLLPVDIGSLQGKVAESKLAEESVNFIVVPVPGNAVVGVDCIELRVVQPVSLGRVFR